MKIKNLVRIVVIKTNPYWPFSILNKLPYYAAIIVFIRVFKRFHEIKSIYLRHGLIKKNWIPALSDIDLTLIINSNLKLEEEYCFLKSFWRKFYLIKKLFPMLGEIDILNDEHIKSWTKLTIRGYDSRKWKLIYGVQTVKRNYIVNTNRLALDSFNDSLTNYIEYFLVKFYKHELPHYLVLKELKRLVFKILRNFLNTNINNNEKTIDTVKFSNKAEMLCCIIKSLEEVTHDLSPPAIPTDLSRNDNKWLGDIDFYNVAFDDQAFDLNKLASYSEAIEGVFFSKENNFIVLKDGLDASIIRGCVEAIRHIFAKQDTLPIIVINNTFKYMLRIYNPYVYIGLIGKRAVPVGIDLLPDITPPEKYFFIKYMVEQTINVLTFPQRHSTIFPQSADWFSGQELESMLERSLILKLYLEKGVIKPQYNEYLTEYRKYYPHHYKKIRELKTYAYSIKNGVLSQEWFRLLKGMANDIHNAISTSNILDNLFNTDQSDVEIGNKSAYSKNSRIADKSYFMKE